MKILAIIIAVILCTYVTIYLNENSEIEIPVGVYNKLLEADAELAKLNGTEECHE